MLFGTGGYYEGAFRRRKSADAQVFCFLPAVFLLQSMLLRCGPDLWCGKIWFYPQKHKDRWERSLMMWQMEKWAGDDLSVWTQWRSADEADQKEWPDLWRIIYSRAACIYPAMYILWRWKLKIQLEDLKAYPYLTYEQGERNSFYYAEEFLSMLDMP